MIACKEGGVLLLFLGSRQTQPYVMSLNRELDSTTTKARKGYEIREALHSSPSIGANAQSKILYIPEMQRQSSQDPDPDPDPASSASRKMPAVLLNNNYLPPPPLPLSPQAEH